MGEEEWKGKINGISQTSRCGYVSSFIPLEVKKNYFFIYVV
jgi:hypothetical protein